MTTARAICALALVASLAMGFLKLLNGGERIARDTASAFAPSEMRQVPGSQVYKRGFDF